MNLIQLTIQGISYSQSQTGAYALVMSEIDGARTLPIIIGAFEAQSIAITLEKEIRPPRPLTHDLFKTFASQFSIHIRKVIIQKLVDGVFYSSLICDHNGVEEIIDARTSDAIAIAVRFQAPIYTYDKILDQAGVYLKPHDNEHIESSEKDNIIAAENEIKSILFDQADGFVNFSLSDLHKKLEKAVVEENYELAVKIRDEISKRS